MEEPTLAEWRTRAESLRGPLRLIVAGGRHYADRDYLEAVLDRIHARWGIDRILHGDQQAKVQVWFPALNAYHAVKAGADALAKQWALVNEVLQVPFPADWNGLGPKAGPMRNQAMVDRLVTWPKHTTWALCFPGGRGTHDTRTRARRAGANYGPPEALYQTRTPI